MLKLFPLNLLLFFIAITFTDTAKAQSSADTTVNGHALYTNIEDNFYKAIGPQSRLYSGEKYEFYNPAIRGNAYFMDNNQWNNGDVLYDGFWYKNLNMMYDIYKDEVIISLYKSFLKLSLLNDKVTTFNLLGHRFIYIKPNSADINPLGPGYYDVLYDGKIQLLCRHEKNIQEIHDFNASIYSYFNPLTNYYLYKNGRYYSVNNKGSFLDALKDKKKDVQQFIRTNKLRVKNEDKEQAMVKIADYYDHLSN